MVVIGLIFSVVVSNFLNFLKKGSCLHIFKNKVFCLCFLLVTMLSLGYCFFVVVFFFFFFVYFNRVLFIYLFI